MRIIIDPRTAFIPASAEALAPIHVQVCIVATNPDFLYADTTPQQENRGFSTFEQTARSKAHSAQPRATNPNLNSFEAVMEAMEEALKSHKEAKSNQGPPSSAPSNASRDKGKGKLRQPSMPELAEEGQDVEEAMAAELKAALETGSDSEDDDATGEDAKIDYTLIKNFLQSFKAQDGLAGPVSNLAGRLEGGGAWTLPRDSAS